MNKKLEKLFDYQKFAGNKRIEQMINETENRYANRSAEELPDNDLSLVNAAGITFNGVDPKKSKGKKSEQRKGR